MSGNISHRAKNRDFFLLLPPLIAILAFGYLYLMTWIDEGSPAYNWCKDPIHPVCTIDGGSQSYFYYANYIYFICTMTTLVFEYMWLNLRKRRIRLLAISLMTLNSSLLIIMHTFMHYLPFLTPIVFFIISIAVIPLVIGFTIFGNHPSYKQGRATPALMTILGLIWNINYLFNLT